MVLFLTTSGEHSDSGHSPPVCGGDVQRRGLMYCLKKIQDFCYRSIMYVTPSTRASLTAVVSIAQLYMTDFANFHGFSVAFIMDRHLLRSVASTVRKPTTQQVQRKNNKPIKQTAKWGGSFMNFWKCKQAESFVRQIIITGCQIMKGGRWVQMSGKWTGREEGGGLKNDEIGTEIVFNLGGSDCFNLHKGMGGIWKIWFCWCSKSSKPITTKARDLINRN